MSRSRAARPHGLGPDTRELGSGIPACRRPSRVGPPGSHGLRTPQRAHKGVDRVRRTPHLAYSFLRHTGLSVSWPSAAFNRTRSGVGSVCRGCAQREGVADHRRVWRERGLRPPTIQPPATTLVEAASAMVLLKHRQSAAATAPLAQCLDGHVVQPGLTTPVPQALGSTNSPSSRSGANLHHPHRQPVALGDQDATLGGAKRGSPPFTHQAQPGTDTAGGQAGTATPPWRCWRTRSWPSPAPRPAAPSGQRGTRRRERRARPAAADRARGPPAAGGAGVDHPGPAGLGAGLVQVAAAPSGPGPPCPLPATRIALVIQAAADALSGEGEWCGGRSPARSLK